MPIMNKYLIIILIAVFPYVAHAQMPNTLSNTDKIYGLSNFWKEVSYNYVYLNDIDKEAWEEEYKRLLGQVQNTHNDYQYYRLLHKFCALLKDGHTNIYYPDTIQSQLYNTYFGEYRIFLSNIENKAIITNVNLSKKDEIPIGTEVTSVNGLKTQNYLKEYVIPYISSSTQHALMDQAIWEMLKAPIGTSFDLELRLPSGEQKKLKLTHAETFEKEVYPTMEDWSLLETKWYDDIAYVALNSFADPEINTLFESELPELYKAKKLIIDLRKNGGGNTNIGTEILKYLTKDTLFAGSKSQSRLHIPSYKAWGKWVEEKDTVGNDWAKKSYLTAREETFYDFEYDYDTIRLDAKRLIVPTVILIGHNTASSAEDFLIYADKQEHMTTMGEPTFGSTGQPLLMDLPGGGAARICTKKDTYPDGRKFVGIGIQPDIFVSQSLQEYLEKYDPALEKALEFLNSK